MSEIFDLLSPSGELATQKEFQALMAGSEAHSTALGEGRADKTLVGVMIESICGKADEVATENFISKGESGWTTFIAALLSVTAHAYKEGWTLGYTETSPSDKQDTGGDSSVEGIEPIVSE
jgi:hypothetical protein|tara:strand:+ start:1735 stop:2097 length:363 start_codon:yes stop_codon:yes gene_type:complete